MLHILLLGCFALAAGHDFKTVFSWKQVDFAFPNENVRNSYIANGDYIPENNMPLGIQVWKDKVFLTVPRWKKGVVSNLNYVSKNDISRNPTLIPYPDWETNNINSAVSIVSIFRVRVDACDRLWGIDTGIEDILGDTKVVQPTRLFVIDLKTDKILRIYTLKDSDQKHDSFLADLVIDVNPNACDDAYAYLSDLGGYGMVVYSWSKNDSWRISHNFFYFDPLNSDYNVSGFNFQWTDGLFGLSLSPAQEDGYKTLYFHAMSGITEFSVSTKVLKNETLAQDYYAFHVVGNKGPMTQGPSSLIDPKTGIDFFTQVNRNGIACWDTSVELNPKTFILVAQDNETLVFPNDLSLDTETNKLFVLSDNLPQFQYAKYNPQKFNFFVTAADVDSLTPLCKKSS